ncbi:MAG: acetate--CoA ligase family protein [Deltaproteobacteria bacterium]|nr:acetate--CoA ligase family protein [Deltaproteobacteria bacterium]
MLDGLFRPRGIGVIGASNNPYSIGYIVIRNLQEHGYKGPIFPINPKGGHIRCFKAFKSILDVDDPIDLVNISVAAKLIPQVIEDCGKKGVKFCIVHSAGFKEVGPEGIKREQEMVALAHEYGMRIFGPNSQGAQNADPEISSYANFTFVPMRPGNISIVAQGGGMGEMLKLHLYKVGIGHRLYCSYGNESDLTMPEILEYYGQDPGTRVIMMQTESFKDPAAFVRVAAQITPHKPILAIKAGRTREGSVAVASHTGTLVDQVAMARAMYRKAGVVQYYNTDDMIRAAIALGCQEPPPGRRIGMITNTGGPGIQAVDESVDRGLTLATWSPAGKQRLKESLYAEASLGNPVDVVATANADHYFAAVDTLLREESVDMVLVFFVTAPFTDTAAIARRLKEAIAASNKPTVIVIETFEKYQALIDDLRGAGIPVYEFAEDGARALAAMANYGEIRRRQWDAPPDVAAELVTARARVAQILAPHLGTGRYLSQAEAFDVLAAYGIPAPRLQQVASAADLDSATAAVGFPCVLKVDSAEVVHKSDEGGVALGLADRKALDAAFAAMRDRFAGTAATFVVQEQRPKGRELIVGVKACPGLGSLVMFGLGGVFVEVMRDVAFALAPLGRAEARAMMREIKGFPLLEGVRGEAPVDLAALEDVLVRVARLGADFPAIAEMDLNPVFAYPAGTAPVAVDVRLKVG